jgi:choline-glycine betaine transporter
MNKTRLNKIASIAVLLSGILLVSVISFVNASQGLRILSDWQFWMGFLFIAFGIYNLKK